MGINPVYATVTQIKIGNRDDFGTGFFYNFLDETYLITNKHLLAPSDAENANEIIFFIRSYNQLRNISWITVSLEDGIGEDWFEYTSNKALDYDVDIAVIPINQRLSDFSEKINTSNPSVETGSLAFTPEMILQGDGIVSGGDVVLVVGYPDGLLDSNTYIPLLRDARISTPFGLAFQQQPKFITDAMMYPGMSGSPIVAGPRTLKNPATGGLRTSSRGFALLGIHSGNYERADGDRMERLNLNAGWYAKLINIIILNILLKDTDDEEELIERIGSVVSLDVKPTTPLLL
ncbi:serine protease [Halorubrum sp. AJ67]|uniref:S1 family peptidase n=1 Tax=Halorubrum sp. AJ67 TaxID=1173487 RepID=UPI0003DC3423|nr:serine protease [Halorubrum sp. AJ67]CDK39650.1 uncharacterized protein BN903_49 [Halorubrum sp. AJ67]